VHWDSILFPCGLRCSLFPPKWRKANGDAEHKDFPDALHKKLRLRAKRQGRSLAREVTYILSKAVEQPRRRSILELRGLGKEYWAGIDAAKYIAAERDS
jgi:plasmid stability protein